LKDSDFKNKNQRGMMWQISWFQEERRKVQEPPVHRKWVF